MNPPIASGNSAKTFSRPTTPPAGVTGASSVEYKYGTRTKHTYDEYL